MRYLLLLFLSMPLVAFAGVTQEQVNVRLVTDEAEAVLNILAKKKANEPIAEADWQQLFATEGYIRLKQRETSMQRSFEDADFRTFVLSDQLAARAPALREALDKWKRADITGAARLALNYLPKDARISAKIVGGASMFGQLVSGAGINVGERNVLATREALAVAGIPVLAEDTGLDYGRSVYFHLDDGRVEVRSLKRGDRVI